MKRQNKEKEKLYAKKLMAVDSGFTEVEKGKYFEIYSNTILKYKKGRVLDIGCGTGIHSKYLAKMRYEMYASDLSSELIVEANRKSREKKIKFLISDAERIPFKDKTFDYMFCGALLHHLPNRTQTIREIRRVLKKGGKVFSFDPNKLNPYTFLCQNILNRMFNIVGLSKNERSLSPKMLEREFSRGGFSNFLFSTITMFSKRDKGIVTKIRPLIIIIQKKMLPKSMAENTLIMECEKRE